MKKRAFVKYSKSGKLIPGTTIITSGKYPKGGPYKEIPINLCCDTNCFITGGPLTLQTYTGFDGPYVTFNGGPTTLLFIEIGCGTFGNPEEGYWSITLITPELSNITELLAYVNSTLSTLGVFTAELLPIPGKYNIILQTNDGILNTLFPEACNGNFYMGMENYN